jgi:beta-1,4-mannosyltransferase
VEVLEFRTGYFLFIRRGEIFHMHFIHSVYQSNVKAFFILRSMKPYKGIQQLMEAFNELKDPACCLLIVGKPTTEMKEMLEDAKLNNNEIKLDLRFIPNEEIYDTLDSANVLVLPYEEITTSGPAILALSYYKPIIAPKAPFLIESFNEYTAILYDANDPKGLEKALIQAKTMNFERNKPYSKK